MYQFPRCSVKSLRQIHRDLQAGTEITSFDSTLSALMQIVSVSSQEPSCPSAMIRSLNDRRIRRPMSQVSMLRLTS